MTGKYNSSVTGCVWIAFLLLHTIHLVHCYYGRCREQPISCYECDSRFQPNCADPFHHALLVYQRNCQGCCTKTTYLHPEYYVVRTCADFGSNRILGFDLTCDDRSSVEKKCYCNHSLCNKGNSLNSKLICLPLLTTIASILFLCLRYL